MNTKKSKSIPITTVAAALLIPSTSPGRNFDTAAVSDAVIGSSLSIRYDSSRRTPQHVRISQIEILAENALEGVNLELQRKIKGGSPLEKQMAIENFMLNRQLDLIPTVINAILDSTALPRQGDTGWGTVYHIAATAIDKIAQSTDGKTKKERGYDAYSFHSDVGTADQKRRQQVHGNWVAWWETHRNNIIAGE